MIISVGQDRHFDPKLNLWSSLTYSNAHGMNDSMNESWNQRCSTHQEFTVPKKSAVECLLTTKGQRLMKSHERAAL